MNIILIFLILLVFCLMFKTENFSDKIPPTAPKGLNGDKGELGDVGQSGKIGEDGEKSTVKGAKGHSGNRGMIGFSSKGKKGNIGNVGPRGKLILPKGMNIKSNKIEVNKEKICLGSVCITEKDLKKLSNSARYVKISCPNPYLQLSEVEVYGPESNFNLAINKPTKQSSTGWGGTSNKAVDGNKSGNYRHRSTSHTNNHGSWWQVDLRKEYDIGKIVIYTRTDCCTSRINNSNIQLIDSSGNITQEINYGSAEYRKEFIITQGESLKCAENSVNVGGANADIAGCGLYSCNSRYNINSIEDCENKCINNIRCKMYSWAPKGGDKNHVSNTVCTLYGKSKPIRRGGPNQVLCKPKCPKIEDNIDYPGQDLKQLKNISSAETCRQICSENPKCKSFTYGKPNGKWYDRTCFLKKTYGHKRTNNNCCKSGRPC
jgi:hypothetical protein